jgi:glycosyltransferase involved in cell wall biosynthesis
MKAGMLACWILKNWKIPYIVSEHSSHYGGKSEDDFEDKPLRYRYQVKKIFEKATIVTNVSSAVGEKMKELFAIRDLRIIRNTVDTSLFHFRSISREKFRFIHVSTLMPHQKNTAGLLRVFSRLAKERTDVELSIVGPPPEDFRNEVGKMLLKDRVFFTGEISYAEVARQMQDSHAFVLFSRYENFPCVVIEALCCGLPVIASNVGGIREAVNETNGLLVDSEDEEQLYQALKTMIKNYSRFDRKEISDRAARAYSYDAIGSRFYQLYNEAAASGVAK